MHAAPGIDVELCLIDPEVVLGAGPGRERIRLSESASLRLLGTRPYPGPIGPRVVTFALDLSGMPMPATVAGAVWEFLGPRLGGRGIVSAQIGRHRPGAGPDVERHELWYSIPIGSRGAARERLDAFFAEALA